MLPSLLRITLASGALAIAIAFVLSFSSSAHNAQDVSSSDDSEKRASNSATAKSSDDYLIKRTAATLDRIEAIPVTLNIDDQGREISEVFRTLSQVASVEILLGSEVYADDELSSFAISTNLRQMLDFICKRLDLTWGISGDVIIVSEEGYEDSLGRTITRVYDISDILGKLASRHRMLVDAIADKEPRDPTPSDAENARSVKAVAEYSREQAAEALADYVRDSVYTSLGDYEEIVSAGAGGLLTARGDAMRQLQLQRLLQNMRTELGVK